MNIKDRDYINLLNQQFKGHYFESDTLLLGFILGWTKDQVNAHCNQLISANALGPLQGQSVTVNTMANSYTISTWIGYNYGFQFDSVSRCEGFIDFGFENDSLRFLKYFIRSPYSIQSVKDFIARKYGKPIYSTYNTSISYEEPKLGLVWIRNGKEIQLFEWENYLYLQYSDLKI
ncbi:MAG TPA: hypothetical protein VKI61_20215, partial [Chitinophagaceae bacterium]|nr:hypothetical protein [Chitinophagaceae bacterium]